MADDTHDSKAKPWRSANELCKDYVGGADRFNRALRDLRLSLIADIIEQTGISPEEAAGIVEHNFVRRLGPGEKGKRGPKALYATADAVRLLPIDARSEKHRRERLLELFEEARSKSDGNQPNPSMDDGRRR
ncbi:MAG: hypothetical protein ACLQVF_18130 [Isosphaeraceae bacterium]